MSHRCPHCHGSRFIAARIDGVEALELVLDDGRRCGLRARLCDDCGLVELVAPHERFGKPAESVDDVQQSDF